MQLLSSRLTGFCKRGFPIVILVLLVAWVSLYFGRTQPESLKMTPAQHVWVGLLPLVSGIGVLIFLRVWVSRLADEVHLEEDGLRVQRDGVTSRVAWADIESVREWWWINPSQVVIKLRRPVQGATELVFLPPLRVFAIRERRTVELLESRRQRAREHA